jgi:hypothetical protein
MKKYLLKRKILPVAVLSKNGQRTGRSALTMSAIAERTKNKKFEGTTGRHLGSQKDSRSHEYQDAGETSECSGCESGRIQRAMPCALENRTRCGRTARIRTMMLPGAAAASRQVRAAVRTQQWAQQRKAEQ